MTISRKPHLQWLPALLWMGLIFLLSHQPKAELAAAQPSAFLSAGDVQWNRFWQLFFTVDWDTVAGKGAHVVVFGILAYLLWQARPQGWFVLGIAILYGLSDEMHQIFTPGRTPKLFDVLFDKLGALLVVWWLHRAARRTEQR
jgi:VanZ family protein